jgi:hypothetical protein
MHPTCLLTAAVELKLIIVRVELQEICDASAVAQRFQIKSVFHP